MKERISGFIYEESKYMRLGTFHSFCNFLIRNEADRLGLDSDFIIYDEEDSKEVLKYYSQFEPLAHQIDQWRKVMQVLRPYDLLNKILEESKLPDSLKNDSNCKRRLRNLDELIKIFCGLDDPAFPPMESLRNIISVSALGDDRDRIINKEDKALIITAHQSKGLEFDTVFIAGATDNCFPPLHGQKIWKY